MEAALEQYLILAKTAKGKACEALIGQAISNPRTFVFGELLDAVQEGGLVGDWLRVLEVFAYGTLKEYREARLPDLQPAQLKKLQMLTLASLAAENPVLQYEDLLRLLEIGSTRQLEDLIIDSIYEGLIKGKIDHKKSCLRVFECFGRDLRPEMIPKALMKIREYVRKIEKLEEKIEENVNRLRVKKEAESVKREEFEKSYKENKEAVRACIKAENEGQGLLGKIKKQLNLATN
jgi:COP9 signalosome complex subunit 7